MKFFNKGFLLIFIGLCALSMMGCTSKKASIDKTFNTFNSVADMLGEENKVTEDETPKEEALEEAPEVIQPEETEENKTESDNTSGTKPSNTQPSTNNTNKNTSSKYPYYIKVNRLANCVTIYTQDANGGYTVPIKAMVCSVGKNINKTPTGVFKTGDKYTWRYLYGDQYGQYATRITGHILFHSVPYTNQSKNTLKTDYYNNLGIGDSMGCIRLTCADAKWIYDNCAKGTTVEIYDNSDPGPLGKPTAMKIDVNSPNAKWDPTDPDSANPWKTTKPTISGVIDMTVSKGTEIDYISNVSATDAYGVSLNVSTSGNVDINKCGEYVITYTATDARGNTITKTAVVTVVESTESDDDIERDGEQEEQEGEGI